MAIMKMLNIKEGKRDPSGGLKRCIHYIMNPAKTESCIYAEGSHCPVISAEAAYAQMVRTKELYGKVTNPNHNCRQGYHYVLSFSPDDPVTPEMVLEITEKLVNKMLPDYEAIYAVHLDKAHLHSHICFNSVSYAGGHMYHYKRGDFKSAILPEINRLCEKYGLSTIEIEENKKENLTHSEWESRKHGRYTVIGHIQEDIDRLIPQANTYEELLRLLRQEGYSIRDGAERHKHLAIIPPGYEKAFRTDRLGEDYTPEGIRRKIANEQLNEQEEENSPAYFCVKQSGSEKKSRAAPVIRRPAAMYRVVHIRVHTAKGKRRRKLTYFEKCYLKYYLKFAPKRHPTWQESKAVAEAQQMAREISYIVKERPGSEAEVERRIRMLQSEKNKTPQQQEDLRVLRRIRKKYIDVTKKEDKEMGGKTSEREVDGTSGRKIQQ